MSQTISIIIPLLNEAAQIVERLHDLQDLRERCQLIVVDGGSDDASPDLARPLADKLLQGPRGRARQMNLGAATAQGEYLLFLHADTRLPSNAVTALLQAQADGFQWGRFDVAFDNPRPIFKLIAWLMNWRSRLTGIATGDQAMFVNRQAFQAIGGFPEIALMEDIAISAQLLRLGRPCCIAKCVVTSARRWQKNGVWSTILLMWRLRLQYFFGADPDNLVMSYYRRK